MIEIRHYKDSDFDEICSWWKEHNEFAPLPGMMTVDGTFVVEHYGLPVMTLSVLMTQSKEISYLEGYCARPGLPKDVSHELGEMLWEHAYNYLKSVGYKRVIAFTDKEALLNRYEDLGMRRNMSGLYSLGRVL